MLIPPEQMLPAALHLKTFPQMNQARKPKQEVHPVTREEICMRKLLLRRPPIAAVKDPATKTHERMNPHSNQASKLAVTLVQL